ncbi:MAG: hypothetical protein EBU01_15845 [Crocinitomicaceae bacterium]|nr:hypothetical protein [Crocinitomicaceae bacterium]
MQNTEKALYLDSKKKIQTLINEVGHMHVLQYLLEELDQIEINTHSDFWVLRASEGIEHAYHAYLNKDNIDENNIEMELENEIGTSAAN